MLPGTDGPGSSTESSFIVQAIRHNLPVVVFLVLALAILVSVYLFFNPDADSLEAVADSAAIDLGGASADPNAPLAPIEKRVKPNPVTQRLAQSPPPRRIGLIAGHRRSDSGTECADGLTEVEINTAVVEDLVAKLRQSGLDVDSLDEFDGRLNGYSASALVSVHSDSCDFINDIATGYKIAGSPYTDSSQLSICIEHAYGEATSLSYHPNSITPHMTDYHAFRKLAPGTQALIIEIGFLNLDRQLLTDGSDKIVKGLADGILCFLERVP
ncbi:MAG: N-acetylmuramoyl-L-alanine amidase [Chloroflexota bacterium]|nr:MAG: N-acetylmuramoyl-L-alanine amidase [Chloroflexota bacterium]